MRRILFAVMAKDLRLILRNKQIWLPMVVLPLVTSVLMPYLSMRGLAQGAVRMREIGPLIRFIPGELGYLSDVQKAYYASLNYMFPPLFLLIPLIVGSVIGAGCLVAEKEARTLETLLYAPVSLIELLLGKLVATFVPAYAATLGAFALFVATVLSTAPAEARAVGFPVLHWAVLLTTVCPALILLGLSAMVVVSAYASTFQGAQQLSSFIVLPLVLALLAPMSGLFALETPHLIGLASGLVVADALLLGLVARRLTYERLLEG